MGGVSQLGQAWLPRSLPLNMGWFCLYCLMLPFCRTGTDTVARHLPDMCHFPPATPSPLIAQIPDKKKPKDPFWQEQ